MSQRQPSQAELEERLIRTEKELIRLRKLFNETTFYPKLQVLGRQIGKIEDYRWKIRTALGTTEETGDCCDCCRRTGLDLQRVEETATLCGDCGCILYQALWRIERSRKIPNVGLFLEEVRSGNWKPEKSPYVELAALARS